MRAEHPPELGRYADGTRPWLGLGKKEGRAPRSGSWTEKKASPSSPAGSMPGSEEKPARVSELSRDGDTQWECSGESSMLTEPPLDLQRWRRRRRRVGLLSSTSN